MKITQVTPGTISIPPNGWGAVEKIIWNYSRQLKNLGHDCEIRYLNDVDVSSTDITHIHIANLAIEAHERGIPYIFSLHDHHVVYNGKESFNYKQNLEAIKHSVVSFCHAEYLVDFFEETDKLFYLSHGVDCSFFKTSNLIRPEHKLLCLANNGIGSDSSFDRKGFRYAIEAAKALNLPITIAGPENNKYFFEHHPDLLEYDKLTLILDNPNEDRILELYKEHSIFLHPSCLEAGHPNLTLLEALSCGLPVVGTYSGSRPLPGMLVKGINTIDVVSGIEEIIHNYEKFVDETQKIGVWFDWGVVTKRLAKMYKTVNLIHKEYNSDTTKNMYVKEYGNKSLIPKISFVKFNYNFINGPFLEILGDSDTNYTVLFIDDNGNEMHKETIKPNHWIRLNRKYYTKWTIRVFDETNEVFHYELNYENKRVYIHFETESLGDTLAWIPYVEEFRKKHNCKVVCSTFKNFLFESKYPDIEFVSPGSIVNDLHGMYKLGWFYNSDLEPELANTIPLQKAAANILGLEYKEIRPEIINPISDRPFDEKYITIAPTSTAQLKYWNFPNGWQILVNKLIDLGYTVVWVSKEDCNLDGVIEITDKSIDNTINVIHHSEFLIGLSSGLAWLGWAMDKMVVMISNFTEPGHEFTTNCVRIINHDVCNSCWNNPMFKFDKNNWYWCPEHENTSRQFECHTSITPDMVMNQIKHLL